MTEHPRSDQVHLVLDASRASITFDRPRVGNALSASMVEDIELAVDNAESAGARLLVFRGNGRHFCTGFDLSDLNASSDGDLLLRFVRVEQLLQRIYRSPITTVAIAKGRVFGAGADLFAACDRRIALPGASFAFPGPGFGLILGTRRLATRIGCDATRRILLSGGEMHLEAASRCGLVTDVSAETEIDALIDDIWRAAIRLSAATVAAIHEATASRSDEGDLAALVTSASYPGLKDRIVKYRADALKK